MLLVGSRLAVKGTWDDTPLPDGRLEISLNPGMYVFGFGDHISTRMFVPLLEGIINVSDIVLDIGTGTGILGIAAARLGAAEVFCTDINDEAVVHATANVAANGLEASVHVIKGTIPKGLPPVDLIVCNIDRFDTILEVIKASLPVLKTGGILAILPSEQDAAVIDQILGVLPYTESAPPTENQGFVLKTLAKD